MTQTATVKKFLRVTFTNGNFVEQEVPFDFNIRIWYQEAVNLGFTWGEGYCAPVSSILYAMVGMAAIEDKPEENKPGVQ